MEASNPTGDRIASDGPTRARIALVGLLSWLAIGLLFVGWDLVGGTGWVYGCPGGPPPDLGSAAGCQTVVFPKLTYGETYFLGLDALNWILGIVPLGIGLVAVLVAIARRSPGVLSFGLCLYAALMLAAAAYTHLSPGATWQAEPVWIIVLAVLGAGVTARIAISLERMRKQADLLPAGGG